MRDDAAPEVEQDDDRTTQIPAERMAELARPESMVELIRGRRAERDADMVTFEVEW
ncbi:MAG TPA: hypothetical protein VFI42_15940 [Thermomicrobiaceae bacterium]|nr:hypothetical protein [Thermomicrobiaceae bacterium]